MPSWSNVIRSSESTKGFLREAQLYSHLVGAVSQSISEASLHEEDLLCPCPSNRGQTQNSAIKPFEVESIGHAVCDLPESCCCIKLDHMAKHT